MSLKSIGILLLPATLMLVLAGCGGQAADATTVLPMTKFTPVPRTPTDDLVDEALAELFWIDVEFAGADRKMGFEDAKEFFSNRMIRWHASSNRQLIDEYGINPAVRVPFCINLWAFLHYYTLLASAATPAEAAPYTDRMVDLLRFMEQDVKLVADGETEGRVDRALCEQAEREVRAETH